MSRASIVITSFNYGRFVGEAIDSALNQTWPDCEVIVVDDGSTDSSREIIAGYGARIVPVLKDNAGQTSALNAGFRASRGQALFFVDADDVLLPSAVERAMAACLAPGVSNVHWPLLEIDTHSHETGKVWCTNLPSGDLQEGILRDGPDSLQHAPTTGNAFSRWFLEKVLPIPEVRAIGGLGADCADSYLCGLAPLYGRVVNLCDPQAYYRVHGQNGYSSLGFEERLQRDVLVCDQLCNLLSTHCLRLGAPVDQEQWKLRSWAHRLGRAVDRITTLVPMGSTFILVDDDQWKTDASLGGRARLPLLEHEGRYWGNPPDGETAIREVNRLRRNGAQFLIFAWPAFWWLDYYAALTGYLHKHFTCIHRDGELIVFDLRADCAPELSDRTSEILGELAGEARITD